MTVGLVIVGILFVIAFIIVAAVGSSVDPTRAIPLTAPWCGWDDEP